MYICIVWFILSLSLFLPIHSVPSLLILFFRKPMAHFLYPFSIALFTGEYLYAALVMYVYETIEATVFNRLGSYSAITPGGPSIEESTTGSIVYDPFMGWMGILFAVLVRNMFRSPMFQFSMRTKGYYHNDPVTGRLNYIEYTEKTNAFYRFMVVFLPITCNGRYLWKQLAMFAMTPLTFCWLDYHTEWFHGIWVSMFVLPIGIMVFAVLFRKNRFEREIVFQKNNNSVYFGTYFLMASIFFCMISGVVLIKMVIPRAPTGIVVLCLACMASVMIVLSGDKIDEDDQLFHSQEKKGFQSSQTNEASENRCIFPIRRKDLI